MVDNPLARTAIECSKEVYPNVLLPLVVFLLFLEVFDSFAVHSFGRMSRDCSGQESRARWSFIRHRCNAPEPDAAGISRTYPCAYGTRNLCQQRMRKRWRVEISGIKMYSGECRFNTSTFPNEWKQAIIVPIFKRRGSPRTHLIPAPFPYFPRLGNCLMPFKARDCLTTWYRTSSSLIISTGFSSDDRL